MMTATSRLPFVGAEPIVAPEIEAPTFDLLCTMDGCTLGTETQVDEFGSHMLNAKVSVA